MTICRVDGCASAVYVVKQQLCSRHYNRLRKTGTTDDGHQARRPFSERFWRFVDERGPDECWPWVGKSKSHGYGIISRGGRRGPKARSQRAAWELTFGPIPEGDGHHGTVVRHKCDNRLCCNPHHLELGRQGDNVRDMDARGRRVNAPRSGADHHYSKLTDDLVRLIRASDRPSKEWAAEIGVTRQAVTMARQRKTWKHVT
jgi:hypothetical protein